MRADRKTVWDDFCSDKKLLDTYNVTAIELESLKTVALLGNLSSKTDILFILNTIRCRNKLRM